EDRPLDGAAQQLRARALAPLELEQVVEAAPDLELDRVAPEGVEVALPIAGGDQALQGLHERAVIEPLAPGALERRREHRLGFERPPAAAAGPSRSMSPLLSAHHFAFCHD